MAAGLQAAAGLCRLSSRAHHSHVTLPHAAPVCRIGQLGGGLVRQRHAVPAQAHRPGHALALRVGLQTGLAGRQVVVRQRHGWPSAGAALPLLGQLTRPRGQVPAGGCAGGRQQRRQCVRQRRRSGGYMHWHLRCMHTRLGHARGQGAPAKGRSRRRWLAESAEVHRRLYIDASRSREPKESLRTLMQAAGICFESPLWHSGSTLLRSQYSLALGDMHMS